MRKILFFFTIILLLSACKSKPSVVLPPPPPERIILEPKFDIVSIYIIQADLVVTEFEALIKIDNTNDFAMELFSINYELFGNNYFWADGTSENFLAANNRLEAATYHTHKDVFKIPAEASAEARFTFKMNFINMPRSLLDDVIAMRQVNYRFKGNAQVRPAIEEADIFTAEFDCTGFSNVKKRAKD